MLRAFITKRGLVPDMPSPFSLPSSISFLAFTGSFSFSRTTSPL